MKRFSIIFILPILSLVFLIGCGEKEDKSILSARKAIVQGDYAAAESAVQKSRANDSENQEAVYLSRFLQLRNSTDTNSWHQAISQALTHLETLNADIDAISILEDPDSDELNQQERLIRSRNSISGLLATALATAVEKQPELLLDLAKRSDAVVTGLLEAQKCYQPVVHKAITELLRQLRSETEDADSNFAALLKNATQHQDPQIRKAAIRELGTLQSSELIPTYKLILTKTDEAPEVAYSAIVAVGAFCKPKFQPNLEIVPILQLATRNNSAQVRMHAAKLLGKLQAGAAIDDLVKLLADSNAYVKNTAIDALDRIGMSTVETLLAVLETECKQHHSGCR